MTPAPAGRCARRLAAAAVPLALLSLTACGSDGDDSAAPAASAPASSAPATSAPTAPATSAPGTAPGSAAPAGGTLVASVGEQAFTIALQDSTGAPVTTLPAGTYTIEVQDPSKIHNFHLEGEGVDEETSVPEVVETTWTVTLQPGTYEYVCDPHPSMRGEFTVT